MDDDLLYGKFIAICKSFCSYYLVEVHISLQTGEADGEIMCPGQGRKSMIMFFMKMVIGILSGRRLNRISGTG